MNAWDPCECACCASSWRFEPWWPWELRTAPIIVLHSFIHSMWIFSHGSLSSGKSICDSRASQPWLITCLVYVVFLCDHTTSCEANSLWQMDVGSLTCTLSQIWVHDVHTKGGQTQTNLHKLGGTEKLSSLIKPRVFGFEFRLPNHWAKFPVAFILNYGHMNMSGKTRTVWSVHAFWRTCFQRRDEWMMCNIQNLASKSMFAFHCHRQVTWQMINIALSRIAI